MGKKKENVESELSNSYCNFCQSHDIKITRIIKVQCRSCGKTRLVTAKVQ